LEYQSKGLLQDFDVTVQKFRVAASSKVNDLSRYEKNLSRLLKLQIFILQDAADIPKSFPCKEYVIKAQVLAGGRGKGHFDNGFKVKILSCEHL